MGLLNGILKGIRDACDALIDEEEPEPLLIAPENSNGKYLLPVYDLRVGAETAAGRRPATPERKEESK